MSEYDWNFYKNRDEATRHSAHTILSLVLDGAPPIASAVDIGCGVGTWLSVLHERGVHDIQGIDGPWVQKELLKIPPGRFASCDLSQPIDMPRRFDLAISLEVAEHLPESKADSFVDALTGLADIVLFSAAIPGQGGTTHVNEQWQNYWAEKFSARGYEVHDIVRPAVWDDDRIPVWYRQNTLLFAKRGVPIRGSSAGSSPSASRTALNLVHPVQFKAKDMDRLGVRGSFSLLLRSLRRYVAIR